MFAGDALDRGHVDSPADFLKLLHALHVDVPVLGVVGEVPGKQNNVGANAAGR